MSKTYGQRAPSTDKFLSSPEASWHADYRDTAYIYIGGLPFELSEGDVITIFSQFGEPAYINLVRDKETGKSRGFAFLKYEDQRSTDLAVDNLAGAVIMGRTLKVDHTRYKKKDDEPDDGVDLQGPTKELTADDGESRRKRRRTSESESEDERPMMKEERELAEIIQEHDEDDPMKAFLIEEKKEEVALALARVKEGKRSGKTNKHRHHRHRSRRHGDDGEGEENETRQHKRDGRHRRRSRFRGYQVDDDSTKDEVKKGRGPSEYEDERSNDYRPRRRSPRRGTRDRIRGENEKNPR